MTISASALRAIEDYRFWSKAFIGFLGPALAGVALYRRKYSLRFRIAANVGLYLLWGAMTMLLQLGLLHLLRKGTSIPEGLLPRLSVPLWINFVVGIFALEIANYGLHRAEHKFPWLWRFHSVHHSDREIDISTYLRRHPFIPVYTMIVFTPLALLLGLSPYVLIAYAVIFDAIGFIHHSHLEKSALFNRVLRYCFLISPVDHHVHHSQRCSQTNSNYGTIFSVFDRIFGTYRPVLDTTGVSYGLAEIPIKYASLRYSEFPLLLASPFLLDRTQLRPLDLGLANRAQISRGNDTPTSS